MGRLFAKRHQWKKLGIIAQPDKDRWWWKSHSMIPTPMFVGQNLLRIYFSGRNNLNQSHIGWLLLDINKPTQIIKQSSEPVLFPGKLGCFDDNGVTPSCVVNSGDKTFLYYIGWNPGSTVRMHLFGGLAISEDCGLSFKRWSEAPILERTKENPYLNTAPFVLHENNLWRMYYVSGVEWRHKDLPRYNIQYAESENGKIWDRKGHVAIDFASESENALARPFVIKEDGIYKMWFSAKGSNYQMGYAESFDGKIWQRDDSFGGLETTPDSFDSEMIEYFSIVNGHDRKYMFYNGNNYGAAGIGVAVEV